MDAREQKGLEIAARFKVVKLGATWLVSSRSQDGVKYTVSPTADGGLQCACPDHTFRRRKCKHLWAVEFILERERAP